MTILTLLGQTPDVSIDFLSLVMRWLHILAAITAVGGTIFARFVVLPSQHVLNDSDRERLHAEMRSRWSKTVAESCGSGPKPAS